MAIEADMRKLCSSLAFKAFWQLRVKRRPFVLSHGINARCNLKCRFCEYWSKLGKEMSRPEIYRMLEEAHSFGIGVYNAWTVEPLLRPDLPEILKYAKGLGLMTSLITNGHLLRQRAHELKDLDYLSISLDGIQSYRELRGADYKEVLVGIKAAQSHGYPILLNCVISGKNIEELEALVRLADSLRVWISFEPLHESGGIDKEVWDELGIRDLSKYEKAVQKLIELKADGAPIINSLTYLKMAKSRKPEFRCHASSIILHVAADGTIANCRVHGSPLGHISQGLSRVWETSGVARKRTVDACRGCLFFGYAENSLLYEFVPEVMAHYQWL
jgi:MoaA/NifB/PqqE/SkfB family radical SAM enzyme